MPVFSPPPPSGGVDDERMIGREQLPCVHRCSDVGLVEFLDASKHLAVEAVRREEPPDQPLETFLPLPIGDPLEARKSIATTALAGGSLARGSFKSQPIRDRDD